MGTLSEWSDSTLYKSSQTPSRRFSLRAVRQTVCNTFSERQPSSLRTGLLEMRETLYT